MSFFDTTPLGNVMNRIGNDINNIDSVLPGTFAFMSGLAVDCIALGTVGKSYFRSCLFKAKQQIQTFDYFQPYSSYCNRCFDALVLFDYNSNFGPILPSSTIFCRNIQTNKANRV